VTTVLNPAGDAGLPTLAEVKSSPILNIAGVCPNTDDFLGYLNESVERLLYRGDWRLTVFPIQVTVHRGIVTMPRMVGSVRALNLCHRNIPIFGDWYRFLPYHWKGDQCLGSWIGWMADSPVMTMYGNSPTYAPIPTKTCVLKMIGIPDDDGKVIQVFGTDENGLQLQTDNGDGTYSDGISFTLAQPFVVGSQFIGQITRVIKPITQSYVQCYALDTSTGDATQIANWEPSLTNPSYAQYKLNVPHCDPTVTTTAIALIKIKFVPALVDSDVVQVPNLSAIKLMFQAIRLEEAGNDDDAQKKIIKAVRELNLQLQDDMQEDQIPIVVNGFGTASPARAGIGRMI